MEFLPSDDVTRIKARLDHPIIDADGHAIEYLPVVRDVLRAQAGDDAVAVLERMTSAGAAIRGLTPAQRRAAGSRMTWWGLPTRNTLDRGTAMLPGLLAERLPELGIDHAVLYPTYGLDPAAPDDDAIRRPFARAFNTFYADTYRDLSDRLTPVGIIPMHTPEEAIAELEFATAELGLKAFMFGGPGLRPSPGQDPSTRVARWVDTLGPDPVRLRPGLAAVHRARRVPDLPLRRDGLGGPRRRSRATSGTTSACSRPRARRWPGRCSSPAFPTGSPSCGSRSSRAVSPGRPPLLRPARPLGEAQPGGGRALQPRPSRPRPAGRAVRAVRRRPLPRPPRPARRRAALPQPPRRGPRHARRVRGVRHRRGEDIRDVFTRAFHFGCEADDPLTALAFDTARNPLARGSRRCSRPTSGTGTSPTSARCCPRRGSWSSTAHATEADFRSLTFENPISLWAGMNPSFFDGTTVEGAVRDELERSGNPG